MRAYTLCLERLQADEAERARFMQHVQALVRRWIKRANRLGRLPHQPSIPEDAVQLFAAEVERDLLAPRAAYHFEVIFNEVIDGREWQKVLEEDLSRLPARLVGQEKEVWDIWDRLRAESEFRAAIAGPLVFVGLAVWPTSRVVPVILCAAGGGLILLAAEKRRSAKGQLFEVAAAGRVSLPSI